MKKIKKELTKSVDKIETYDFLIIGAGVAGLSAAMYGARLGLRTLCLGSSHGSELPVGGVITTTNIVENYPGFIKLTGEELAEKIKVHALSYELVSIKEEKAEEISKSQSFFKVKTDKGQYLTKTVLFATGTKWKKLDVPGAKEFENKGVAFCALCDGPLYRNKIVAVVGGSDSAAKDALVLAEYAKKVYIIYRKDKIRAEPINIKRIESNNKIEIINNANVTEVKGEKSVKAVFLDREFNGSKELSLDGVFIAIGHMALSNLAKNLGVNLNEKEEIIINHKNSETNIPGIYAAGDVADKPFKQAITGVAEGCAAAYSAFEYITKASVNGQ
jgi:thioredoxin reductase (NADPH)